MAHRKITLLRAAFAGTALIALGGCEGGLDFDLRNNFGNGFDTSSAVRQASAPRPAPDDRGVISYPSFQVVVAQRGDTIADVAARVGVDANELARYNGISPDASLRRDEIIALPGRVAEPSLATGGAGPILPEGQIDVETLAGNAINQADTAAPTEPAPATPTGEEPVRHKVERGETAYSISRLYGVSVRALADWNGLGPSLNVREGQYLLIPVSAESPHREGADSTTQPGEGTPTPLPPSASTPLPENDTTPASQVSENAPASPDLSGERTEASGGGRLLFPVVGNIIRPYLAGSNEGIDIAADAGTPVRAADAGTVAAITQNTDEVPVLVIRHAGGLLTVYANIGDISVAKGDQVTRGQAIAKVQAGDPAFMRFEVRQGFDATDPMPLLN